MLFFKERFHNTNIEISFIGAMFMEFNNENQATKHSIRIIVNSVGRKVRKRTRSRRRKVKTSATRM